MFYVSYKPKIADPDVGYHAPARFSHSSMPMISYSVVISPKGTMDVLSKLNQSILVVTSKNDTSEHAEKGCLCEYTHSMRAFCVMLRQQLISNFMTTSTSEFRRDNE